MFLGCSKLEYINLKNANIKPEVAQQINSLSTIKAICNMPQNLENILQITNKIHLNCINNKTEQDLCYIQTNNNPCNYCGSNYYQIYNENSNNNTNINCYNSLEEYFF